MKKILTGIKPTGNGMHMGNYFGALKPLFDMDDGKNDVTVFLPDFHSLTSIHNGEVLRNNRERLLKEFFALMPEKSDITVFEQSKINNLNNIVWILNSVTPYSMMLRAHSFKDSQNKNSEINMAVFNYPILMTADIISYDFDIVPVGKDQKQHLEFARDIARNFNKTYNCDIFKLPEAKINEDLLLIPGTDGRKMSKSYDNFIGIFDSEKIMKKKIMTIVTGSETLEEPKNPDNCNIFALIKLFASESKQEEIKQKYLAGNYGYGHAKLELLEIVLDYFKEAREKYNSFENNMDYIYEKLEEGNAKMNKICDEKYEKILRITGLKQKTRG
ncbi:MAG: tryptophan--tRNA ligase [Candidatus Gracilibacteria bacterium]|nr:tryptophan--tRNA ligase [Candidatus Gracilibacteria bacterium]MDQ7023258.1 tryptophan--tRNA ligase [Candidatus Gracilibacteria bacterium]